MTKYKPGIDGPALEFELGYALGEALRLKRSMKQHAFSVGADIIAGLRANAIRRMDLNRAQLSRVSAGIKAALCFLFLLGFTLGSHGDVLVYKVSGTYTLSGGGTVARGRQNGWTVIDPASDAVLSIYFYADKTFRVDTSSGYTFTQLQTSPAKTSTAMARASHLDAFFAKGANQTLFIGTTNLMLAPFTWTTATRTLRDGSMLEATGVLVFDRAWTLAGNLYRDTAVATINRLAESLRAKGYTGP